MSRGFLRASPAAALLVVAAVMIVAAYGRASSGDAARATPPVAAAPIQLLLSGATASLQSATIMAAIPYTTLMPYAGAVPLPRLMLAVPYDGPSHGGTRHWIVRVLTIQLYVVIALVCIYLVRHFIFTLNRLFGAQRHPYLDVDTADWPGVTVLVPAHDEEAVIGEILDALVEVDYPHERLTVIAIDDRSRDRTGEIIDDFVRRHPDRFRAFHRRGGNGGKAAALNAAMEGVLDEVVLVFDADYIPGRGLIKQLVAPFFDPEVGAVMGRVVPHNVGENVLTRMLDLERSGGYQVDQQSRMNMHLVPQYGGTVGGVRRGALESVGGWRDDTLAEDTDATVRLLLAGWKTAYQNRSECYEQVPDTWRSRMRQLHRWARGHDQVLFRYIRRMLTSTHLSWREKFDGILLLGVYLMSPILLTGWLLAIVLWYMGVTKPGLIVILAVTSYSAFGNFAIFFEVGAASYLDGTRERIRLLPFMLLGFVMNLFSITRAAFVEAAVNGNGRSVTWHRTAKNGRNGVKPWD